MMKSSLIRLIQPTPTIRRLKVFKKKECVCRTNSKGEERVNCMVFSTWRALFLLSLLHVYILVAQAEKS